MARNQSDPLIGAYFTPPHLIKKMVELVKPKIGETIYDPACGIGGMLLESKKYIEQHSNLSKIECELLNNKTFYGRELNFQTYLNAIENLGREDLNTDNLWNGNTLLKQTYNKKLPDQFDVILSNPPFSANATEEEQQNFEIPTRYMELLFLQHIIESLKPGGRCVMLLPEGVLKRTGYEFRAVKEKLIHECAVKKIIGLDEKVVFYANIKFNIIVFTKGHSTQQLTYQSPNEELQDISLEEVETNNYDLTPGIDSYSDKPEVIFDIASEKPTIFVNYRHKDTAWATAWLCHLLERSGVNIFYDNLSIETGQRFDRRILEELDKCIALIVMIGDEWLTDRLENTDDWVRLEIEKAIKREIMLIPILVDNAKMPPEEKLPETIKDLSYQRAMKPNNFIPENFIEEVNRLVSFINANLYAKDHA